MSKDPRQQRHRFSGRLLLFVFKTIIAIGQAAALIMKLLSVMSER